MQSIAASDAPRQTCGSTGPAAQSQELDRSTAIRELREFGKGRKLDGLRIRDLIDEGRRS